jgi:hypothetical protein
MQTPIQKFRRRVERGHGWLLTRRVPAHDAAQRLNHTRAARDGRALAAYRLYRGGPVILTEHATLTRSDQVKFGH